MSLTLAWLAFRERGGPERSWHARVRTERLICKRHASDELVRVYVAYELDAVVFGHVIGCGKDVMVCPSFSHRATRGLASRR